MSPLVVTNQHIEALVTTHLSDDSYNLQYHFNNEWHPITYNEQEVGQILLNENFRAVNAYICSTYTPTTFTLTELPRDYTAIEIVKLCDSLEDQSCELYDWSTTEAYAILQAIRRCAINSLPGYNNAPEFV